MIQLLVKLLTLLHTRGIVGASQQRLSSHEPLLPLHTRSIQPVGLL